MYLCQHMCPLLQMLTPPISAPGGFLRRWMKGSMKAQLETFHLWMGVRPMLAAEDPDGAFLILALSFPYSVRLDQNRFCTVSAGNIQQVKKLRIF